jgi:hypothetical protein
VVLRLARGEGAIEGAEQGRVPRASVAAGRTGGKLVSLLLVDEVLAAGVGEALEGVALQAALDREEAWLARRIGPLAGERTQRFPLALLRPTTV